MSPHVVQLSDTALLLRVGDRIDAALNAQVHALATRLREALPAGIEDLVPGYASLAVFLDSRAVAEGLLHPRDVSGWLEWNLAQLDTAVAAPAPRTVEIPVCYGGTHGPDLDPLAAELGLSAAEVIERHGAGDYRVALLGFAPGFPYLLGLDPALAAPRLATPRARVPAGSVGIGGAQTGIYPREGPGGWRLIGRTPLRLFDPRRDPPALIAPGDALRFVPIESARFAELDRTR